MNELTRILIALCSAITWTGAAALGTSGIVSLILCLISMFRALKARDPFDRKTEWELTMILAAATIGCFLICTVIVHFALTLTLTGNLSLGGEN